MSIFYSREFLLFISGLSLSIDFYLFSRLEFFRVYDFLVDVSNDLGYSGRDCEYGDVVILVLIERFSLFLLMDCV